jgi:hypothetical protein
MTPSPYTQTSWLWILTGQMFFTFKNQMTDHTFDAVLYKPPWHSNKLTRWLGKQCGHEGRSDDGLQKPPVNALHKQGAQMVLTLKIWNSVWFVSFLGLVLPPSKKSSNVLWLLKKANHVTVTANLNPWAPTRECCSSPASFHDCWNPECHSP